MVVDSSCFLVTAVRYPADTWPEQRRCAFYLCDVLTGKCNIAIFICLVLDKCLFLCYNYLSNYLWLFGFLIFIINKFQDNHG